MTIKITEYYLLFGSIPSPTSVSSLAAALASAHVLVFFCMAAGLSGNFDDVFELVLDVIECLCVVVCCSFHLGLCDLKGIIYRGEFKGVLYFQDGCYRAVDDRLYEVCGNGLAGDEFDTTQCILKAGAEARTMLANWGWPGLLLGALRRHAPPVATGPKPGYWLHSWRLE